MIQITDYACYVGRKSTVLVKRLLQFVVSGLALLATAQPLLAETVCDQPQCESTPVCSTWFDSMAIPTSALQPILASSQATLHVAFVKAGCSYGCCWLRSNTRELLLATPPTFRLTDGSRPLTPVAQFSASHVVILAARSSEDAAAGAVPRNILFQVFRI